MQYAPTHPDGGSGQERNDPERTLRDPEEGEEHVLLALLGVISPSGPPHLTRAAAG